MNCNPDLRNQAKREFSFLLNGAPAKVLAYPMERLLDVLRSQLGLTGSKEGCGEGECGACSVRIDGALVDSCLVPVAQAAGTEIVTIEGASANPNFAALSDAFLAHGGAQCGICTPGMIMAALDLFDRKPSPAVEDVREALAGNLCRCTGYLQIIESVMAASRRGTRR